MSNILRVERIYYNDATMGRVTYKDFSCASIELPWINNEQNISCIPDDSYLCKKIISPNNGHCFEILNVPNRTDVQGHIANYLHNILGCVGFGESIRFDYKDNQPWVTNSTKTFNKLIEMLPDEFVISIS